MRKGSWGLGSLDALGPLLVSSVASGVRQQHIMAAVCDRPRHHGQNAEEKKETRAVVFLWPVKAWPGDISESLFTLPPTVSFLHLLAAPRWEPSL